FTRKPKIEPAQEKTALDRDFAVDPEFAPLFDDDVPDVDFRIPPRKPERTFIQVQTFKGFFLRKLAQLLQQRNILDSPVSNTQQAFAGRAFQLRILSVPVKITEGAAVDTAFPFGWQLLANRDRVAGWLDIH